MPELPEVETIVSDLKQNLIGHKIIKVDLLWPGIVKELNASDFNKIVMGKKIVGVVRRAKNINIQLSDGINLLMHMKMTGHLIYTTDDWKVDANGRWIAGVHKDSPLNDPLNQSIRALFHLDKGKIIAFSDIRKFAYIKVLDNKSLKTFFDSYGPEPLSDSFTEEYLHKIFSTKNTAIKKVIMDQKNIAGIGNIYADEILFKAKIHPLTPAKNLNSNNIKDFRNATIQILKEAIKMRGTSTSDFRDLEGKKGQFGNVLNVYRRTGLPCTVDGTPIKRIVVGGRGTHFCPKCQVIQ